MEEEIFKLKEEIFKLKEENQKLLPKPIFDPKKEPVSKKITGYGDELAK